MKNQFKKNTNKDNSALNSQETEASISITELMFVFEKISSSYDELKKHFHVIYKYFRGRLTQAHFQTMDSIEERFKAKTQSRVIEHAQFSILGSNFQFPSGKADNTQLQVAVNQTISMELLGKAIKEVQSLFWGQSSYAIIFCTLRDIYGSSDNCKMFEKNIQTLYQQMNLNYSCPPNTISSSFHNNGYMKMPISRWEANNVKPRAIKLSKAFIAAIENLQNG